MAEKFGLADGLDLDSLLQAMPGGSDVSEWDLEQQRKREAGLRRIAERVAKQSGRARPAGERASRAVPASWTEAAGPQGQGKRKREKKRAAPVECSLEVPPEEPIVAQLEASAPPMLPGVRGGGLARLQAMAGTPAGLFLAAELLGTPVGLRDPWPAQPPAPRPAPEPGPESEPQPAPPEPDLSAANLFRLSVRGVLGDKLVSPRESQFIRGIRRLLRLQSSEELKIVEEEKARAKDRPDDSGELDGERLYTEAFALACRDRKITAEERRLLDGLAELFGIDARRKRELEGRDG